MVRVSGARPWSLLHGARAGGGGEGRPSARSPLPGPARAPGHRTDKLKPCPAGPTPPRYASARSSLPLLPTHPTEFSQSLARQAGSSTRTVENHRRVTLSVLWRVPDPHPAPNAARVHAQRSQRSGCPIRPPGLRLAARIQTSTASFTPPPSCLLPGQQTQPQRSTSHPNRYTTTISSNQPALLSPSPLHSFAVRSCPTS